MIVFNRCIIRSNHFLHQVLHWLEFIRYCKRKIISWCILVECFIKLWIVLLESSVSIIELIMGRVKIGFAFQYFLWNHIARWWKHQWIICVDLLWYATSISRQTAVCTWKIIRCLIQQWSRMSSLFWLLSYCLHAEALRNSFMCRWSLHLFCVHMTTDIRILQDDRRKYCCGIAIFINRLIQILRWFIRWNDRLRVERLLFPVIDHDLRSHALILWITAESHDCIEVSHLHFVK